ncbi:MAG TPA: TlpA disulfide reductase family protein [Kofleriaceae bacterium]|jgi:thiol-disulfide isomerase/thioredoxin|nr:TlpA disulfide reductase family protein [Kofleriaceae bacterium]
MKLALVVILGIIAGCKEEVPAKPPPPQVPTPASKAGEPSWYRGVLQAKQGEFQFLMRLPAPGTDGIALLKNGRDELERPAMWTGDRVRFELPVFQTAVSGTRDASGALAGVFESHSRSWGASSIPWTATPIAGPDLTLLATVPGGAPIDLGAESTEWKLEMEEEGTVRMQLAQVAPGNFEATVMFANGNYSYLAGNGRGDRMVLTAFDGIGAMRLALTLSPDRATVTGEWLSGQHLDWRARVTGNRATSVTLTSSQPSPHGKRIELPQLADLAGKPVIVELAGSWCSVCRNAAPVLRSIHDTYRARGLAIVTLLYEFTDDPVANREQAELFTKTYDIPWKVEAVPGEPEDLARIMPPGFEKVNISGFPIALFLDANHTLVALHAGFPAPGTPAHQEAVESYRKNTELIVRKP